MFKKLLSLALSTVMVMVMGTIVFASSDTCQFDTEHVGDIITYDTQNYIVYQENEDGTVYAVSENAQSAYAACSHRSLEPINPTPYPPLATRTPNPKISDYCYEQRTVQAARCST